MSANAIIPLAEGFEEIEAVTIIDVLRRAGVEVVTASISPVHEVTGAHGMVLRADALFSAAAGASYDAVILPGGGQGTENLRESEAVLERLRRQREEERLICAICAAPTVLVQAGVLDPETHVTCYPTCASGLDRPSSPVPVVADGLVITGQAPGAALLFSLVIVQALMGEEIARRVAQGLVTDVL